MRICPCCTAKTNDFDPNCEYCGANLPVDEDFQNQLNIANDLLSLISQILSPSYNMTKDDLEVLNLLESTKLKIETTYSESVLARKMISRIQKDIPLLKEKVSSFKNKKYKHSVIKVHLMALLAELSLILMCCLMIFFDSDTVQAIVIGIPEVVGIILGIVIGADSGKGFIGAIAGFFIFGILGLAVFWLISNPYGRWIWMICGSVVVITAIVMGLRKEKKTWLV